MKRFLFCVATALLAGSTGACTKEGAGPAEVSGTEIYGEWDWVHSVGGIAGLTYTPASTGVATRWVFKTDGTFQEYDTQQGTTRLVQSTTFAIGSAGSIHTGQPAQTLIINRQVPGPTPNTTSVQPVTYVIQGLGAQLVVADNYADGFGSTYQRR
ncbi:hypothetical protein ACFQ48_13680 [Hymenobacter caeli]|uniref:Lipocalin-like domain-containing protein n=1 Tax=Hymenobacter caeli TaxID=2735894 RepID=A0ABX2FV32_9BACT|nr:hypothetical protein [Hymenobacter caeli]NRT20334.1 hypothetical protein [Hymenobacter caeli]